METSQQPPTEYAMQVTVKHFPPKTPGFRKTVVRGQVVVGGKIVRAEIAISLVSGGILMIIDREQFMFSPAQLFAAAAELLERIRGLEPAPALEG